MDTTVGSVEGSKQPEAVEPLHAPDHCLAAIKKRVCFLRLRAYSLFNENGEGHFGGAEVRAVTFAKELALLAENHVSFVTYNYGQDEEVVDGVRVLPGPEEPTRVVEGSFPEQANAKVHQDLRRIVQETDHEIYCCFGVNEDSAAMIAACRKQDRKSVLFTASDTDLSQKFYAGSMEKGPYGEDGNSCFVALKSADEIVVQTERQLEYLRQRFSRDGILIRNPVDLRTEVKEDGSHISDRSVLWVGRADTIQKKPDTCLEIARRMQSVPFVMILNRSVPTIYDRIVSDATSNVHIVERVPYSKIGSYFAHAYALCNTSAFEGFPNTLLHAGKYGIPFASFIVDPDGCLERSQGGHCAHGNVQSMVAVLDAWHRSSETATQTGRALRSYVEKHHDAKKVVLQLRDLLVHM